MTESQETDRKDHHPIFVILLVVTESILTLLLRIDQALRAAARPLIKSNSVIKVTLTKPRVEFYAEFNQRGILLDFIQPEDSTISASIKLPSLLRLDIFLSETKLMQAIKFSGADDIIQILKTVIAHLSIAHLLNKWFAMDQFHEKILQIQQNMRMKNNQKNKQSKSQAASITLPHTAVLLEQLNTHQKQLDTNAVLLKEKDYTIRQMQRKLRRTSIIAAVLLLITILLAISCFIKVF